MSTTVTPDPRDPAQRVFRVKPSRPFFSLDIRELLRYHELLYVLVWRDVRVRYKQTALGVLWAVIQPLAAMVIFSIIFGHLAGIQSPYGVPYPLFVFTGLLPWQYFAACLTSSTQSVVGNANLVTKVYFPRLIVPLAAVCSPVIDFLCAFCVLLGLFVFYSYPPHWHAVAIPVFLGMALLTAFGVGLWLSALNTRYRDIPYLLPFMTQIWFFLTPVIYPVTMVPQRWHWIIALNPMSGVVDGFRWAVLGKGLPHYGVYALSALVGVCLTTSGLWYFKRAERTFADVI